MSSSIALCFHIYRMEHFQTSVRNLFEKEKSQTLKLVRIVEFVNKSLPAHEDPFTGGEISAAVKKMSDDNLVMLADDILFLV